MNQLKQIFKYTTGLQPYLVIIAIGSVVGAATSFIAPVIIKHATDWVMLILQNKAVFDWYHVILYAGLLLLLIILGVLITDTSGYVGDQFAALMRKQLSTKYYDKLLHLPQKYYDNETTGKIINRLSRAITEITNFLQFFSNNLLQMILTLTATAVILMIYSWPLAILFVLLVPLNLFLTARTSKKWQKLEKRKNNHFDIASGRFAEVIGQIRLVKSFNREQYEYNQFEQRFTKMIALTKEQSRYWHLMDMLRSSAFGAVLAGIYGTLFYLAAHQSITVGDMAMLITFVQQSTFPIRNLSFFVDSYQRAVTNSKDYLQAMSETPEVENKDAAPLTIHNAEVVYKDVTFGYDAKNTILKNVSFTIAPGTRLALVGESGSGKTTLSNLLMGLYTPESGSIAIDGHDVASVYKADVRKNIATVFQDAALFSGTIRENVMYGRPDATDRDVEAALKAANAEKFVSNLPKGLNTEIGERGIKLSGGQKQRLAIARAILKDAPILILDEATSSLDSKAEHDVQEALDHLMKNRTTLIIAHRLSTIAGVDIVVTLKNGYVDEIGSPTELATTGGIYSELLRLQLHATERDKKRLQQYEISA